MNVNDLPANIASKIAVDESTGCWVWTASKWKGYGRIRVDYVEYKAHRLVFHLLADPTLPPKGTLATSLDHVADRCATGPSCVNPEHLERVTHRENVARGRRSFRRESVSRFVGVTKVVDGAWQCQMQADGRCMYVGRSMTDETYVGRLADAAFIALGERPLNFVNGLTDRMPNDHELDIARRRVDAHMRRGLTERLAA